MKPLIAAAMVLSISAVQARQLAARHGAGRALGPARRAHQHISPGIIISPLARDEFNGPRGAGTAA